MSPSTFNSLFTEMVEAGKAMEELPQVREQLAFTESKCREYQETIANREERILNLKSDVEALQSKIRDAEVARDDAELRFLELDEKAGSVSKLLRSIRNLAEDGDAALTPPKPEPTPEPEPVKDHAAEELAAKPFEWPEAASQGQSESHPTADASANTTSPITASSENATSQEPVNTPSPDGPYSGKFYYEHPVYVSLSDWIAGGGSEENYYRSKPGHYTPQRPEAQ